MGKMSKAYKILAGKLGRPRNRKEDNIKMNLKEMNWILLVHNRIQWQVLLNMIINL
jgi:hypothetical protein